jgi:type IV pilus assembly protein PilN
MLAEINLLPQKQQRNYTNLLAGIMILMILISASLIIFTLSSQKQTKLANLEQEFAQAQQQTAVLQQQASEGSDSAAIQELEKAIQWSQQYPVDFVPLLNHLTEKLPDRGYFYRLDYIDSTSLNLLVQFETSREAAYYLSRLKDSTLLEEVKLTTVEASSLEDEEDIVPRYLATYQLVIDRAALKKLKEEDKNE